MAVEVGIRVGGRDPGVQEMEEARDPLGDTLGTVDSATWDDMLASSKPPSAAVDAEDRDDASPLQGEPTEPKPREVESQDIKGTGGLKPGHATGGGDPSDHGYHSPPPAPTPGKNIPDELRSQSPCAEANLQGSFAETQASLAIHYQFSPVDSIVRSTECMSGHGTGLR